MNAAARRFTFLPDPPAPALRFEPRGEGREVAVLGVVEVGEFSPAQPWDRYFWRCWLPMCAQMGRAGSPDAARDALRSKIEQWVEAAGLNWGRR